MYKQGKHDLHDSHTNCALLSLLLTQLNSLSTVTYHSESSISRYPSTQQVDLFRQVVLQNMYLSSAVYLANL